VVGWQAAATRIVRQGLHRYAQKALAVALTHNYHLAHLEQVLIWLW
jgi:hypothetical protein